jgi:hypothetical protein
MGMLWRAVIIAILCLTLSAPARADSLETAAREIVVGIVVVSAGLGVLITVLIVHHKNKKVLITGCIASTPGGMSIADDKDKRSYAVSGDPIGLKAGEHMTLEGKRHKLASGEMVFQAHSVIKDLGACAL